MVHTSKPLSSNESAICWLCFVSSTYTVYEERSGCEYSYKIDRYANTYKVPGNHSSMLIECNGWRKRRINLKMCGIRIISRDRWINCESHLVLLDFMSRRVQRHVKSFITKIWIELGKPCNKIPLIFDNGNLVLFISYSCTIEMKSIYFETIITWWIIFIIQRCPVITIIPTKNYPFPWDISKYIIVDGILVELNNTRSKEFLFLTQRMH